MYWRKSIEDLCEKCSTSRDLCIRFQKTAARTLLFLSEAVSPPRWQHSRPGSEAVSPIVLAVVLAVGLACVLAVVE